VKSGASVAAIALCGEGVSIESLNGDGCSLAYCDETDYFDCEGWISNGTAVVD
jgi:hypothetical protein